MLTKILDLLLLLFVFFAIIAGFLAIETCWEYWKTGVYIDTPRAIVLLSSVLLFSAGILALSVFLSRQKK